MRKGDNITMSFTENFRKVLKRRTRNAKYFFQWLFTEKIRGLDFTMKKITGLEKTEEYSEHGYHGYAKSPEEVVRRALGIISPGSEDSFIDVGCGKGITMREAAKFPFRRIAGIEFDEGIYNITVRNFMRLGLQERVRVFHCRAEEFEHYGDYNVFYFFNPFGGETRRIVLEKIFEAVRNTTEHNRTQQNNTGLSGYSTTAEKAA